MFNNIGKKIKIMATVLAVLGILASIIAGIVVMSAEESPIGLLIILGGSLISWISSFITYGFGQLIENSDRLVDVFSEEDDDYEENVSETLVKTDNGEIKYFAEKEKKFENPVPKPQFIEQNDSNFIDIRCPHCHEMLSYPKDEISTTEIFTCPFCGTKFKIGTR